MKKRLGLIIVTVLVFSMLCTSCSGGPLDDSEVVGKYDDFECDSDYRVWLNGDDNRNRYVTVYWEITDPENGKVTFTYEITDENVECYDEDFWTEYHEAGFVNPEDALEEYMYEIAETYELPPEGDYQYDRSEKKLSSVYYAADYYKKD